MSESETISVSELNAVVRGLIEDGMGPVHVRGEISNFRRQSSGHLYFTLKDAGSQVRAVMFRGDAARLKISPADGQAVILHGELTVYEPRGEYQVRVTRIELQGRGTLQERFEALKRQLQAEGLFEASRKKPLPVFPQTVAVITSPTGAALQDFLNIIGRRCPRLQIRIFGVRVQGEGAAAEVAEALAEINRQAGADVIVVARGGGSLEDLWAFNEEVVARAVAASQIPVISGVGHEIDFTICDFAADLRAPTPSAAAELLSLPDAEWRDKLGAAALDLERQARAMLEEWRWKLSAFHEHYVFREPVRIVDQWAQRLDEIQNGLARALVLGRDRCREKSTYIYRRWEAVHPGRRLEELRRRLSARRDQLRLLSPQQTLDRGYAIVFDEKGAVLRQVEALQRAEHPKVRLSDGELPVKIADRP